MPRPGGSRRLAIADGITKRNKRKLAILVELALDGRIIRLGRRSDWAFLHRVGDFFDQCSGTNGYGQQHERKGRDNARSEVRARSLLSSVFFISCFPIAPKTSQRQDLIHIPCMSNLNHQLPPVSSVPADTLPPSLLWPQSGSEDPAAFDTSFHTDWLVIQTAGQPGTAASSALETICRTYWYPLYAYVRRRGHSSHDAQDLTQGFFARLLATPWLQDLHPSQGRFRAFLLASMNHFLAKEWRREQAQKRGGGLPAFSLDSVAAEDRYRLEPSHNQTPDKLFQRQWAMTLLQRVLTSLRQESVAAGKGDLFEELKGMFDGEKNGRSYAQMAGRLGMTEAAVKKAAQRLRNRYHELLRAEVARTVSDAAAVDEEIHCLFAALVE